MLKVIPACLLFILPFYDLALAGGYLSEVLDGIKVKYGNLSGLTITYSREVVTSTKKGCIRDRTYCTRLYSPGKISNLLQSAGFSSITCQKDFMNRKAEGDYGYMTNRMVVTAIKT